MKEEYIKSINRILLFIDENLDQELSLAIIATIGYYSPFHLHRIFKAITNETINEYITRKRIEKTASILLHKKEITIAALSLQYGFNSNSSYTRTFKKFYGISPTEFRKSNLTKNSKISKVESKNGQQNGISDKYICNINNHKNWITMKAKIEIKEMPALDLAFITHIGHIGMENTYSKLIKWATAKGLLAKEKLKLITIYHDSFKITDANKVRMSACISLEEKMVVNGEVGLTSIEKGKYIVARFEIKLEEFEKSWSSLFIWMNENGYKKNQQNPHEIYHNNFNEHPEKISIVDLCIPIE